MRGRVGRSAEKSQVSVIYRSLARIEFVFISDYICLPRFIIALLGNASIITISITVFVFHVSLCGLCILYECIYVSIFYFIQDKNLTLLSSPLLPPLSSPLLYTQHMIHYTPYTININDTTHIATGCAM